jgi:hypothetical protein
MIQQLRPAATTRRSLRALHALARTSAISCAAAQSAMSSRRNAAAHEGREKVGCAGEHRAAERSELAGVIGVTGGPTVIDNADDLALRPELATGRTAGRLVIGLLGLS